MKNMYKMTAAGAAMALAMGSQSAMADSTVTADVTTTLVSPINVAKTSDLAFGQVAIPSNANATKKIITLAGARDGASTANDVGTQIISAAVFTVTGQGTFAYTPTITVTENTVPGLSLEAMRGQCDVDTPEDVVIGTAKALTGCTLAGASIVKVAGTLKITEAATSGPKTVGTVNVTVAYN